MRTFKLYAIHKAHQTLITSFDNNDLSKINTTVTYDEQLSESENDQYTLTFSMPRYLEYRGTTPQYNYWLDIVKLGSKLRLVIDNSRRIDLIVSSVAPSLSKANVIYNFTAQDELSYLWARHNIGYSYPYLDEDDDGPHTIVEYAERIMRDNYLNSQWVINHSSLTPEMTKEAIPRKFTFTIDDSNPYNALVEAANVLGYKFKVDYTKHTITFYLPDENKFSGYRYRPETNLKSFSASYEASELCTLMHSVGGTDANDQIIPLVPALPHAFKTWFVQNGAEWSEPNSDKWIKQTGATAPYTKILDSIIQQETANGVCTITNYVVTYAKVVTDGQSPYQYFIGATVVDPGDTAQEQEQYAIEQLQTEVDECVQFAAIADKVPYLGQFLCDFSFFDSNHNNLMTDAEYDGICRILDLMRINNVQLKIDTPVYYNILYTIAKRHGEIEALAEQCEAEYRVINDKCESATDLSSIDISSNDIEIAKNQRKITDLLSESYFKLFTQVYGNKVSAATTTNTKTRYYNFSVSDNSPMTTFDGWEVYPEWQTWIKNIDNAETQYKAHKNKYLMLQSKLAQLVTTANPSEAEKITLESEIASEQEYMKTYETLKSSWEIITPAGTRLVPGKWSLILGLLHQQFKNWIKANDEGLAQKIKLLEDDNNLQSSKLYNRYGAFIYESTYENTDELDSVGLYNQTVANFALYNKPSASYSLTTIDLNCLEQISVPNVTVGSHIKVYNELLDLDDGKVNNLQFTDNDLVITAISRKLRSSDDVSFTVEKTNKINKLVEKLLINIKKE